MTPTPKGWGHRFFLGAVPPILNSAGIDVFFTQKISWNQFNKFPHHSFNWVGIDGTTIQSHFFPSDTYNAESTPKELIRGDNQYKQSAQLPAWLQAYGYGDGGGGPTEEMIEFVDRLNNCAGVPHMLHASVQSFADRLVDAAEDLPTWEGELYLERHRGTYTTHASFKRCNRKGEIAFKQLELLQVRAGVVGDERQLTDKLWKEFLLNQFHDIIPGSSIEWVNREARALYESVAEQVQNLIEAMAERLLQQIAPESLTTPDALMLLNTRSHGQGGLIELEESLAGSNITTQPTRTIGGKSRVLMCVADGTSPGVDVQPCMSVPSHSELIADLDTRTLENDRIKVTLDAAGRVVSLIHKATAREMLPQGEVANQLVLYDDRPMAQEAWAVDIFYRERAEMVEDDAEVELVEDGPWRIALEFRRPLGRRSRMVQRVELARDEDWVTFNTSVDWSEERTILRALHPVDVRTDHATFEIQYGHVRRPNHFNTSWDVARFESPAQRWTDLSEPGFGVTLLNDCKYGHSALGNVLGISLLRGPRDPDETADIGTHRFRYALRPHADFDAADATRAAEVFNEPLHAWPTVLSAADQLPQTPVVLGGSHVQAVAIEAIKPAENGHGTIVRIRETRGGRGSLTMKATPGFSLTETDLLERPLQVVGGVELSELKLEIHPFEFRTFRIH